MSSVIGTLIGRKMATESLVSERLGRCETCPFLAKNGRCTKCTCPVKDKAKYATIFHPRATGHTLTKLVFITKQTGIWFCFTAT